MYGDATLEQVDAMADDGCNHMVLLMRHSAREFNAAVHDLENPLTDEGRELSRRLGRKLPKAYTLRGYASPAERCVDTAQLCLDGHAAEGGSVTRVRPVEGLGVFYVLDQMKMYRVMRDMGTLQQFVSAWSESTIPEDALIPAQEAARILMRVVTEKLNQSVAEKQIDVCVSHDLSLYLVRDRLLGESPNQGPVEFLDTLLAFRRDNRVWLQSARTNPVDIPAELARLGSVSRNSPRI